MIRIMLVDDEPIFISDLKEKINSIGKGFKVIYEAYDAQDAMKNIKIYQPDIIFTDIKMPGINGICLVKEIKKQYSHIIPIILSGYHDFDLARDALRANADDYLVKPIDEQQLKNILINKSTKVLDLRKNSQMELLTRIVNDGIVSINEIVTHFNKFSYYFALQISPSMSISENNLSEIDSILSKNETYWILNQFLNDSTLIVFGLNQSNKSVIQTISHKFVNHGCVADKNHTTILLSPIFHDIRKLHDIIKKMMDEKDVYEALGQSIVIFDNNQAANCKELYNKLQTEYKEKIQNALWTHNWHSFCDLVAQALEFCQSEKSPKILIKKFLFRITISVEKNYAIYPQYTELNIENHIEKIVESAKDHETLSSHYTKFLLKIFCIDNENNMISDEELMSSIDSYLKENLTKKINVETVCKHFFISQPKMNRIFKKYKNSSFIEYLTFLKIEEAKSIMQSQPNISINHLASVLGFTDNLYFSKVFKKTTSLSPTQYKKYYKP